MIFLNGKNESQSLNDLKSVKIRYFESSLNQSQKISKLI